jgi:hypothetical protein
VLVADAMRPNSNVRNTLRRLRVNDMSGPCLVRFSADRTTVTDATLADRAEADSETSIWV